MSATESDVRAAEPVKLAEALEKLDNVRPTVSYDLDSIPPSYDANDEVSLCLTLSELRLIHELMFFFPPAKLNEARMQLVYSTERKDKNHQQQFKWGAFLRRKANQVYQSLAQKLDCKIMVSPAVSHIR